MKEEVNKMAYINKEIAQISTNTVFLKLKANAFGIEKVQFSFVNFDSKTKKQIKAIEMFLNFDEFTYLYDMLTSNKLARLRQSSLVKQKNENKKYPDVIYQSPLGGIHEQQVREKNLRSDGNAISRHFTIQAGSKYDYIMQAKQGAGKTDEKGLIVPLGKPEDIISVPVSAKDLRKAFNMVDIHIKGFIASQYVKDAYNYVANNQGGYQP